MDNRRKIASVIFTLFALTGILFVMLMPSHSPLANIDFSVFDTNDNYHYEVNERLEFIVNDTAAIKGKHLLWQFGNGDTLIRNSNVEYTYKIPGKYLVTLKIDGGHSVSKYIKVISGSEHEAIDTIPHIYGVSEGYQGEGLVFSAEGAGMDTWLWEFGESGTVDAYEKQVIYTYETPGRYTVKLQTNTTKYPITHNITILPRFEKAEELVTVDSIAMAQDDIKRHLQAIANAKVSQRSVYYDNTNYIKNKYFCMESDKIVVIVNDDKYNDFMGYCQGLHFLESNKNKRVSIDDVKIDQISCVTTIHVTQSYIEK